VTKAASRPSLSVSAKRITYGREHGERLAVSAAPQYGGTPAGTVRVTSGRTTICTIRLASGKGSCLLSARQLRKGTYHLTATCGGSADFGGSTSAAKTVTVVK
jgi:Bacterial Ig-like domain (group 3)